MQEEIKNLLLTWEEYNRITFRSPYIFSVKKGTQILVYFGAEHINDPSHSQYKDLSKEWNLFIEQSSNNRIAIGEGRNARPPKETIEEAVNVYGEQGYLRYLADKAGVEVLHPDPSELDIWNKLISKYSKDELFFHDILQLAHQWNRGDKEIPFEKYIEPWLHSYRTESDWEAYPFTFAHIQEISPNMIDEKFDQYNSKLFYDLVNPSSFKTRFNAISRDIDMYRDSAVVGEILTQWKRGKSVFIVFGSSHAVIQERAIKQLAK